MKEYERKLNNEIKIRGKIISVSLLLERELEYAIFHHFKPRTFETKIINLFIDEFIKPISFGKKIRLYNELLKTEIYQKKINLFRKLQFSMSNRNEHLSSTKNLIEFITQNTLKILEHRNTIAHGFNAVKYGEKDNEKKGNFIFFNKRKKKVLNEETLEPILINVITISTIIYQLLRIEEDFYGNEEDEPMRE
jgi:hypothetical protein